MEQLLLTFGSSMWSRPVEIASKVLWRQSIASSRRSNALHGVESFSVQLPCKVPAHRPQSDLGRRHWLEGSKNEPITELQSQLMVGSSTCKAAIQPLGLIWHL